MEMFDSDIFCKRANELFDGMGQMELSQKMGLSQGVISAIKNGKSKSEKLGKKTYICKKYKTWKILLL